MNKEDVIKYLKENPQDVLEVAEAFDMKVKYESKHMMSVDYQILVRRRDRAEKAYRENESDVEPKKAYCEAEHAAPTTHIHLYSDEPLKRIEQTITVIKTDDSKGCCKCKNPIYNTLLGGWSMRGANCFDYTCVYGRLRFCYDGCELKDGWKHPSIHWNNVCNEGKVWYFHIAYRWKFPFLKIGFNSIKDLYKEV